MRIRKPYAGFTLIELMIVVVVIAILAAIAIPSYRQHVIKVKRTEAKVNLTDLAQKLQRCYTRSFSYNDGGCVVTLPPTSLPDGYYAITGEVEAQTFLLTATPQGSQADDTKCGNFTLDERGQQNISGSGDKNDCW